LRYQISTDLHANWEALTAVLDRASGQYDSILCLGDIVGYGADPNELVAWVRENAAIVIRGNHDRACATLEGIQWFNPLAEAATRWTHQVLTDRNRDWLTQLPPGPVVVEDFQLVHGSPVHEDEYIVSEFDAAEAFRLTESGLTFFGHTHLQAVWAQSRRRIVKWDPFLLMRPVRMADDATYLVNPGSVGQPRDEDARAAFAIYDSQSRTLELLRVKYDISSTQRKIVEAGLPIPLAERLMFGR
jgi:diadenosine tetraphosphatase ApaH/serine/threonine PP2A family protein phosphatase